MKTLPTRTLSIRGGTETVLARPASEDDWPGIVEMHRSIPDKPWERPPEEMTPDELWHYGGAWMSIEMLREDYAVYVEHGCPILVAEDKSGRIVANIDLWLSEEAEPVGRNAFVEVVQEHAEYVGSGLENAFIGYAAEVARLLGYPALDGSFGIGGLSDDYFAKRAMDFRIWDEHDRIELACRPGPVPDAVRLPLSAEAIGGLVILGRWAPTAYVWLLCTDDDPEGHRFELRIAGRRCAAGARWLLPHERGSKAEAVDVTLFVPPGSRHDAALISELLRTYGALVANLGLRRIETWIPSEVTPRLSGVDLLAARYAGTCLRMVL